MMSDETAVAETGAELVNAKVRKIGVSDLKDVLAKGLDDFKAKPSHVFLLVIMYPILGLFLFRLSLGFDILPLLFPLIAGFALIGPLAAIGLYELSRVREQGGEMTWAVAADVLRKPSVRGIIVLSLAQMAIYFAWIFAALAIYRLHFGDAFPTSITEFANQILTTPEGHRMIIIGCGVGFLFAAAMLTISAISFPMLIDRNVGAAVAVCTSVKAARRNPITMGIWGFIVAVLLAIGSIPFFVGLAVAMPVLGHATWHLYRKLVEY